MDDNYVYIEGTCVNVAAGHLEQVVEHAPGRRSPLEEGISVVADVPTGGLYQRGCGGRRYGVHSERPDSVGLRVPDLVSGYYLPLVDAVVQRRDSLVPCARMRYRHLDIEGTCVYVAAGHVEEVVKHIPVTGVQSKKGVLSLRKALSWGDTSDGTPGGVVSTVKVLIAEGAPLSSWSRAITRHW